MDYYLKTTNQIDLIKDFKKVGIDIKVAIPEPSSYTDEEGNEQLIEVDPNSLFQYYQDESIIIDWIGQIPNPIETDEEGNIIGEINYREGQHVNIRSKEPIDINLFENTQDVYPEQPYRMFS